MNYDALGKPPQGEICIRGPTVFLGYCSSPLPGHSLFCCQLGLPISICRSLMYSRYYKDPGKTAEVIDKDSWFHTGDVGEIADSGALKVIDRKKQVGASHSGDAVALKAQSQGLSAESWHPDIQAGARRICGTVQN